MNPDLPPDNRAELEARVTALLLGELTAEEAAALRQIISQDAALAKLHERLRLTLDLVRVTAATSAGELSEQPAPLKLSPARREALLAHFKTVAPQQFAKPRARSISRIVEWAAVAAIVMMLASLILPSLSRVKSKSMTARVEFAHISENSKFPDAPRAEVRSKGGFAASPGANPPARHSLGEDWPTVTVRAWSGDQSSNADSLAHTEHVAGTVASGSTLAALPTTPIYMGRTEESTDAGPADQGVKLNLRGATVDQALEFLGESAGLTINRQASTSSQAVPGTVDIVSATPVSKEDMIPLFNKVLANQGLTAIQDKNTLTIKKLEDAQYNAGTPINILGDWHGIPQDSQVVTEVIPVHALNPTEVLKDLYGQLPPGAKMNTSEGGNAVTKEGWTDGETNGGVYSLNVVGYMNVNTTNGFSIIANQTNLLAANPGGQPAPNHFVNSGTLTNSLSLAGSLNFVVPDDTGSAFQMAWKDIAPAADASHDAELKRQAGTIFGSRVDSLGTGEPAAPAATDKAQIYIPGTAGQALSLYSDEVEKIVPQAQSVAGSLIGGAMVAPAPAARTADPRRERTLDETINAPDTADRLAARRAAEANPPAVALAATPAATAALTNNYAFGNNFTAQIYAPAAKPAVPLPTPQPEVQTRDNPFSTFSLNVSDVSFKLAAASLQNGGLPDPATVRSEEFINAFDYRDPEPAPGAPIGFAWERAAWPFAHNRDLLRFSVKTAARGRQAGRPLNLVLLLDKSGSMERADRVAIIREALRVLASQLQPQDKLSVVVFARTARLWADGVSGSQAGALADALEALTPEGGTNLEEAMKLAYEAALRHYLANGENRVVVLTDGAANLGDVEPDTLKKQVEANRAQGIALDCFGVGWEDYNDNLLEELSRAGGGRYGFINTPEEAATGFAGQLAGALRVAASDVKVQVEFNPNRVITWRQIGYAKDKLTKEQFRDNTVKAAQIGAAESGNALYTVELNPAGDGPVCTVHVRYRAPGTADYYEHAWDVPYAGAAAALDQAGAAMRLAATASAFSEWLAASPYAGGVTLDQLLGYMRGVPELFGADARPKLLETMLRQARSISGK